MKLIIEIPDKVYKTVLDGSYCGSLYEELLASIPYNPTGDCISRSDLKEAVKTRFDNSAYFPFRFLELIDNAQAIPLPNEQIAWEQGYEAGLAQGKNERPHRKEVKT